MIKFETINGTLCRMVEQPCPHCGQPEIIAERVEDNSHWWALYQMMQGKKVRYKGALGNVYWALNQDGNVQYYDMADPAYVGTIRSKLEFGERTWDYHWQLYKEPEYKVGDFIKYGDNYYIVTSPTTCVGLQNGKGYEICPKTGKIVYPSEEVLDFGNVVKGTVRSCVVVKPSEVMVYMDCIKGVVTKPLQDYGKDIFWLYYSADEYISIPFDALDESTRKMVKSLLKAQESENA